MLNHTAEYTNGENMLTATFRPFQPGEDAAILICLRDEYDETYDAREYYDVPALFSTQSAAGRMEITVVELDGGAIIGFLIMKHQSCFPDQVEMSTMVILKQYRNYHISGALIAYCCARAEEENISAYFGHAQVFHTRSITKLYQQGMVPCGYMLSMFISDTLAHSFGRPKAIKLPWAIIIKAVTKRDAGLLYVPMRHHAITRRVYDSLGVRYELCGQRYLPLREDTSARPSVYEEQNTLWLIVDAVGADLARLVSNQISAQNPHLLTVSMWLNVNDPAAVWAFEELSTLGFFFTGYQALPKGAEYLVMHLPLEVPVVFDDFVPFEPITYLLDYVKEEYRRSIGRCKENECEAQY